MTNDTIAQQLRDRATAAARGGDNLYRVRAFRQAAMAVLALPDDVTAVVAAGGPGALARFPGIGKSLAATIAAMVSSVSVPNSVSGREARIDHREPIGSTAA